MRRLQAATLNSDWAATRLVDDERRVEVAKSSQRRAAARRREFHDGLAFVHRQLLQNLPEQAHGRAGFRVAAAVTRVGPPVVNVHAAALAAS